MIQRALIHVAGAPVSGKTVFVERLLGAVDGLVLVARCQRDPSTAGLVETAAADDAELGRYQAAGAARVARCRFGTGGEVADELFTSDLLTGYSDAVVLEGDSPLLSVDLCVYVARPPDPGQALLVRVPAERASRQRRKAALGQPDPLTGLLEGMLGLEGELGGAVLAGLRQHPELLEQARLALHARMIGETSASSPHAAERWAVSDAYEGIQHAQLIVVNVASPAERTQAADLIAQVKRLRADRVVLDDVLGWRGSCVPVTGVVADLSVARDAGTRKVLARVKRTIRSVRKD